jgi:hypothetical protein
VFDDEKAGAADVGGISEAHEHAVSAPAVLGAAQAEELELALAHAAAPVEQAHRHGEPAVAAGVAVLHLSGDPGSGSRRVGSGVEQGPGRDDDGEADEKPAGGHAYDSLRRRIM